MRFLVDAQLPARLAAFLADAGHDALHTTALPDGNRTTDVGAFKPATATWRLRVPSGTTYTTRTVVFGSPGDRPVVGDWNGDGTEDLGVWRPSTATFHLRVPEGAGVVTRAVVWGTPRG